MTVDTKPSGQSGKRTMPATPAVTIDTDYREPPRMVSAEAVAITRYPPASRLTEVRLVP
jgi:hypothetical protein